MKRNPRPWTKDELALLGKLPDAQVAELGTMSDREAVYRINHSLFAVR